MAKQLFSSGASPITGGTIATPAAQTVDTTLLPVTLDTAPKRFQRMTLIVAAGATVPVMVAGNFVFVEEMIWRGGTPPSIFITFDEASAVEVTQRQTELRFPAIFTKAAIYNPGASYPITVTMVVGFGAFVQTERPLLIRSFNAYSEITRPANIIAYAANQMVADNTPGRFIFADVYRPGSNTIRITKARITKNSTVILNASFKLFLAQAGSQISGNIADQTAFDQLYAGVTNNSGVILFPTFVAGGAGADCAECIIDGIDLIARTNYFAGGNALWGYLVAMAAYVPTSGEKIRVELWGYQL